MKNFRAAAIVVLFWSAAQGASVSDFRKTREDILVLAAERTRIAPAEYQRVLVAGENSLRRLHEDFKLHRSTPPAPLERDLSELRRQCRTALRTPRGSGALSPAAGKRVREIWGDYGDGVQALLNEVGLKKSRDVPENRLYWDGLKSFDTLKKSTEERLLFNVPPGERGLDDAFERDRWTLLKELEVGVKKTRDGIRCVTAPEEHSRPGTLDISPFYHYLDLLPDVKPLVSGAFLIPAGCRTVTLRATGMKLVFRLVAGKAVAHRGSTEQDYTYAYLAIPPDTPYYFENADKRAVELEYVGLKP